MRTAIRIMGTSGKPTGDHALDGFKKIWKMRIIGLLINDRTSGSQRCFMERVAFTRVFWPSGRT